MPTIFLVEDYQAIAKNLQLLLKAEGFKVMHSLTWNDAMLQLAENKFDLALIDISLPDGNVFNTISTNIKLRRREFAILRSVGLSEKDFNKMMSFECVLYGTWTMVWGLPISGILSFLIYQGMTRGGGELSFLFPWQSMTISVFSVFLLVFITMVYAVSEIRKENIIDALRDDLT